MHVCLFLTETALYIQIRENSYKYEISSISKPITNASVSDYWKGYGKLYGDIQYTCQTATDEPLSSSFKTFWHLFGHNIELPLHDIYHKQDFLLISTRQSTRTFSGIFIIRVTKWVSLCWAYVGFMLGLCSIYFETKFCLLSLSRVHRWSIDICWVHIRFILTMLWLHFEPMLVHIWSVFAILSSIKFHVGPCWIYVGSMLCQCWVNVGFISGPEQFDDSF